MLDFLGNRNMFEEKEKVEVERSVKTQAGEKKGKKENGKLLCCLINKDNDFFLFFF